LHQSVGISKLERRKQATFGKRESEGLQKKRKGEENVEGGAIEGEEDLQEKKTGKRRKLGQASRVVKE